MPVQEVLPFRGLEISQAHEGPRSHRYLVRLSHGEIEVKPDAEGQMRELDVDVVLELDIRLYEEKEGTSIGICIPTAVSRSRRQKLQYERPIAKMYVNPLDRGGENTSGGSQNAF